MIMDNSPQDDSASSISTYTLNRRFDFTSVGVSSAIQSTFNQTLGFTVCSCTEIGSFVALYKYLTLADLLSLATAHCVVANYSKPALIQALVSHRCSPACSDLEMVFTRRLRPRLGPFPVAAVEPGVAPVSSNTACTLADLNCLPVVFNNAIQSDTQDGRDFISTYLLNCAYNFVEIVSPITLQTLDPSDIGIKFIAVHSTSVASFVAHFPRFTATQLSAMCVSHSLPLSKTKSLMLQTLISHECTTTCPGASDIFLFSSSRKYKEGAVPVATKESVTQEENARKARVEHKRQVKLLDPQTLPVPLLKKDAIKQAQEHARAHFPQQCRSDQRKSIASQWQNEMDPKKWIPRPCAVCGRRTTSSSLTLCNPLQYDLTLLQNPSLPYYTLPTTYNRDAYDGAILCVDALTDRQNKAPFEICPPCKSALDVNTQPLDALANFQYYARDELPPLVKKAFEDASCYDLMMCSYSRCTRVTHLFSEKKQSRTYDNEKEDAFTAASQGYSKGNVAIFPQDVATLRKILPPSAAEIHEAMCALFVGSNTVPNRENIASLTPVVVSKTRIQCILEFILSKNPFYTAAGVQFSPSNLANLVPNGSDGGVPVSVDLCCLPESSLERESYADRGVSEDGGPPQAPSGQTIMEAVGYTVGERTPQNLRAMKASAVAWCLDKNNFIKMQSGSTFLSDRDPGFLTYNFPHLDPWGIGGFHEPARKESQRISFERQVSNLLLQSDCVFQKDPNFAYVCWNIMQKSEVNKHISFRTSAKTQASVVQAIQEMAPTITELIKKWELNPNAKPSNAMEKKAMHTLGRLKVLAKDLRGSSGYKQCRRNEIRALIKKYSTPAFFITINPADIADPLLGAIGGVDPDETVRVGVGVKYTEI
ncbi:hypothetical protein R3P38DRAFT_3236571 [Favolaschia claudopus]|uniref:Helitron helicase-like domain-containing protein n=1 Tax=Favolaschia claudopus TaxID=2862362 RepID=A0AAV9ZDM5_9AGAR